MSSFNARFKSSNCYGGPVCNKRIGSFSQKHKVDLWESTPSRMEVILSDPEGANFLKDLKSILLAGEAFSIDLVEKFVVSVKQQFQIFMVPQKQPFAQQ